MELLYNPAIITTGYLPRQNEFTFIVALFTIAEIWDLSNTIDGRANNENVL